HPATLNMLESVMTNTAGIRRFGSAALDLAYVAAGRYEGFWESDLKPWDIAAGLVIVMEAGGLVTELTGGPDILATGNVLATNDVLHEPITKLLRTAIKENKNSPS
ncbi:MAG: inositol monophosphatase, partial [Rhodospirillaceae bacterium]|nr:inositol monophosphatase [Rhodospirillaceae bacterium]